MALNMCLGYRRLSAMAARMPRLPSLASLLRASNAMEAIGSTAFRGKPILPGTPAMITISKQRKHQCKRDDLFHPFATAKEGHRSEFVTRAIIESSSYFTSIVNSPTAYTPMTIVGQCSGPGFTQEGYATSRIPSPLLFVTSIIIHATQEMVVCPDRIQLMLVSPTGHTCPVMRVLPYVTPSVQIDPPHEGDTRALLNSLLRDLSSTDPYIAQTFGIDGPGEGFVFFPETDAPMSVKGVSDVSFVVSATRNADNFAVLASRVGAEEARRVQDFISARLTDVVLQDASSNLPLEKANTHQFLIAVQGALEAAVGEACSAASGVDHPMNRSVISNAVSRVASHWFIQRCNAL